MTRRELIERTLTQALAPTHLHLEDESEQHRHHKEGGAGETHFRLLVVATAFEGKSLVTRHRVVNDLLATAFRSGLHALALTTLTPQEWARRKGTEEPCNSNR